MISSLLIQLSAALCLILRPSQIDEQEPSYGRHLPSSGLDSIDPTVVL